jgi:plasmid stabilization system protein ParE
VRIVITPRAFDDLAAAAGYVARDNPGAAGRIVDRVFKVIDLLAEGGLDGPLTKLSSGVEVRSWPVQPLRIYYQRESDTLRVLRIYHQARRPLGT